ncbi:MAG: helix-turn-helix domain-containing protein [Bacteroidota bacterium]
MHDKILFFFAALGVFNAFLFGIYYLFFKPNRSASHYYLGILLLLLAIRVGISCFYYFGAIPFWLIKIGLTANLCIGPTLLFQSLIGRKPNIAIHRAYALHLSILIAAVALLWGAFDFEIWDRPIRYSFHTLLTFYLLFTGIALRKDIQQVITSAGANGKVKQSVLLFLAVLLIKLGFVLSLKSTYILGPLVFSIVFYGILRYDYFENGSVSTKSQRKRLDQDQLQTMAKKLTTIMEQDQIYQDADLSLDILVKKLGTNRHFLSQMLNDHFGKNFFQFVNEYRVEAACSLLTNKQPYRIEAIGYEVGFRSKSAFFATFKKIKGMTPAQYKRTQ